MAMRKIEVIGICGSPRRGNTETLVRSALKGAAKVGAKTELVLLKDLRLEMCDGCLQCDETGVCHFNDGMNEINEKLAGASGFIIGTPARWSLLSGNLKVLLDRTNPLAKPERLRGKVAAIIAVGQSIESEDEKSIEKSAKSLEFYCSNAGIDVIGRVLGYNSLEENDIEKDKDTIIKCEKLGEKLANSIRI